MKTYLCHKKVQAFKITRVDGFRIYGEAPDDVIQTDRIYFAKHNPQPGGYYVRYADGYESFSPAAAFESGYTEVTGRGALPADSLTACCYDPLKLSEV